MASILGTDRITRGQNHKTTLKRLPAKFCGFWQYHSALHHSVSLFWFWLCQVGISSFGFRVFALRTVAVSRCAQEEEECCRKKVIAKSQLLNENRYAIPT